MARGCPGLGQLRRPYQTNLFCSEPVQNEVSLCLATASTSFHISFFFVLFLALQVLHGHSFCWWGLIRCIDFISLFPMSRSRGVLGRPEESLHSQAGQGMAWTSDYHVANFGRNEGGGSDFLFPHSIHTCTVLLLRTLWLTPDILHFSHSIPGNINSRH